MTNRTNRFVVILVGLVIFLFTLFGVLFVPYFVGKLSIIAMPAILFNLRVPLWLLAIITWIQRFFYIAIAQFSVFGPIVFLYFGTGLIALGLRYSKSVKITHVIAYSSGISILVLVGGFLEILNLGSTIAIAAVPLGITTGAITKLFWLNGFHKFYSTTTVFIAVLLGNFMGFFVAGAILGLQSSGNGIPWTQSLFPTFLLQLLLALSLRKQLQSQNNPHS